MKHNDDDDDDMVLGLMFNVVRFGKPVGMDLFQFGLYLDYFGFDNTRSLGSLTYGVHLMFL